MKKLTDQFFERPENYRDKKRQRVYLKDIDCPQVWQEKLREHIPQGLFYWNDGTGEAGGPGAVDENVPGAGRRKGKGIASAGDLMSSLPQDMRADNLMCYIGHEGTYTPAHKEMCASLGQNIMVNASETFDEGGQPEKPGSSIWFMTETKDRHTVSEYWLSVLGHDIEVEKHFAQVVAWQRAPFKVYVVEQKAGDFILVPPLAPHQVWNRGTRTMKVAWNRTTVETLEMAMHEALPSSRMVCRDEQYKNKAMIYYTLLKYSQLLRQARMLSSRTAQERDAITGSRKIRQVQKDFRRLFDLFKEIMLTEAFAPGTKEQCEYLAFDSNVTCAYCRGNMFNRFLTCKTCMDVFDTGVDEPYDVCMDCFAMGRSCACQSKYRWTEQWRWKDLLARYEEWRRQIIELDGGQTGKTPLPLEEERKLLPKKTLAHVCQEQLKVRPWVNVKSPEKDSDGEQSDEEIIVDDDGMVRKTKKKPSKQTKNCHSCCHRHPKWMMVECTMCERGWCYGVLWRAYDLHPLTVMEDIRWECPHCQRICSVGACRKDPRQSPYEPKGTLLGHDTKKVADLRSIECLVDFSKANLNYLGESVDGAITHNAMRLQRRQWEAEIARQNDICMLDSDWYADEYDDGQVHYEQDVIDPALGGEPASEWQANQTTFGDAAMENGYTLGGPNDYSSFYSDQRLDNSFATPTAVVDQPTQDVEVDGQGLQPVFSKKRQKPDGEQIKLVSSKKRKVADEERRQPKNKANKQYLAACENKRLEQARKDGRYIQVLASIKGRKRVVKLNVDGERLKQIISQLPAGSQPQFAQPPVQSVLIQSDIPTGRPGASKGAADYGNKSGKKIRVRIEEDKDFRADKRGKAKTSKYEEIELDSDEELAEDITGGQRAWGQSKRRSEWRSRKHQDDGDLPDELPDNFKDGSVNPRQRDPEHEREWVKESAERRKTMPAAMKVPKIRPATARASTRGMVNGNTPTTGRKRGRPPKFDTQARIVELARAAIVEEDSRQGKLMAADLNSDGDRQEHDAEGSAVENFITEFAPANGDTASAGPRIRRKSIFSGPGGRKIKIVGKKKSMVTVDVPRGVESSRDNIPSNTPMRKGPPGRKNLPGIMV
jgi:hypothetical protein